ncbi:MAG: transposase [Acidobacteriota bacterium]|nr:transposase [Acidobacteriota bacterium]
MQFLDEAGSNLAMTRLFGRAAPGERVVESVPQNYGENVSMMAAVSVAGGSVSKSVKFSPTTQLIFLTHQT